MARIIQLTDLHLLKDFSGTLKGVPVWETFREVLAHIRTNAGDWDRLVISGDLAQDELEETYQLLRDELGDWLGRTRLLPGNHDNRTGLRNVFPEITPAEGEFLSFADSIGRWRILGLDSQWPGDVRGQIGPDQLDWLSRQLAESPRNPTLIFLHHPPSSVNSPWLDKIGLVDPQPLWELLSKSPQVRAIAAGHVHHAFHGKIGSVDMWTTPSACMQFIPGGEQAEYANDPPGYRIFDLDDEGYRTQVHRLPELRYPPREE